MAKQKRDLEEGGRVKAKAASSRAESDDDEDEDPRPTKKKKKKKKKSSSTGLYIGIGAAVGGVLILVIGVTVFLLWKKPAAQPVQQQANVEEKIQDPAPAPIRIIPKIQDGNPAMKKGGIGIVSNIRGAAYRTERRSELRQIAQAYIGFADEYKGAGRTLPNFLMYMKTFGPIREAVEEGYYKINMNARLESSSVIAYERDIDVGNRHLCALGDGSVEHVPLDKLKAILGKDP